MWNWFLHASAPDYTLCFFCPSTSAHFIRRNSSLLTRGLCQRGQFETSSQLIPVTSDTQRQEPSQSLFDWRCAVEVNCRNFFHPRPSIFIRRNHPTPPSASPDFRGEAGVGGGTGAIFVQGIWDPLKFIELIGFICPWDSFALSLA